MRGELLEVVDGIEVRRKPKLDPLALAPGRRGRLEPGGPVVEVHRVGTGAAYLFKVFNPPIERRIGPWDELGAAVDALLRKLEKGTPEACASLAREAAHVANQCRRILVSRGPVEPGISRSTRFIERVENEEVKGE